MNNLVLTIQYTILLVKMDQYAITRKKFNNIESYAQYFYFYSLQFNLHP